MSTGAARIVLLRGLTREARHWGGFPETLAQATGAEVHALDLPGWGRRRAEPAPLSIATTADAVADDARTRLGAGPFVVVGLSLGGMVAIEWARRAPAAITHLVVMSTSAGGAAPPWRRLRPRAAFAMRRLLSSPAARRERRILALTTALASPDDVMGDWVSIARDAPTRWRSRGLAQLLAAARYRVPSAPLAVPSLVLAGARDRLVDPRCARPLADNIGARLRVHPQAGHDLPLDDPQWTARQIADWLIDTKVSQAC